MGGVIGHINHPYENLSLTFYQLHEMIGKIMDGTIDSTEKLDGQQLSVSWKEDRGLVVARNKGHLKNFGENALDFKGLKAKFKKHVCGDAFMKAFKALEFSFGGFSLTERDLFFDDGRLWLSLEVLNNDTTNVIPYNTNRIYFHYFVEYDVDGEPVKRIDMANDLFEALPDSHLDTYTFFPPQQVRLKNMNVRVIGFYNQLKRIIEETPCHPNSIIGHINFNHTIGDWLEALFHHHVLTRYLHPNKVDATTRNILVRRFVYGDKRVSLTQIKSIDPDVAAWVKEYEAGEYKHDLKYLRRPLEVLFLYLGAFTLYHADAKYFVAKGDEVSNKTLRDRVVDECLAVNSTNRKMVHQLYLLDNVLKETPGGILATEGIVFEFDDGLYKLTGVFAPVNQILGEKRFD